MAVESKLGNPVVLGRGIINGEQSVYTIQDELCRMESWIKICQAEGPKEELQKRISKLTEVGKSLGMDSSYLEYLHSLKE